MTLYTTLAVLTAVLYFASAVLPLAILPLVRRGPAYWPAFSFVLLAAGLPGAYLGTLLLARTTGWLDRDASIGVRWATFLVLSFVVFLLLSATVRVVQINRALAKEGR